MPDKPDPFYGKFDKARKRDLDAKLRERITKYVGRMMDAGMVPKSDPLNIFSEEPLYRASMVLALLLGIIFSVQRYGERSAYLKKFRLSARYLRLFRTHGIRSQDALDELGAEVKKAVKNKLETDQKKENTATEKRERQERRVTAFTEMKVADSERAEEQPVDTPTGMDNSAFTGSEHAPAAATGHGAANRAATVPKRKAAVESDSETEPSSKKSREIKEGGRKRTGVKKGPATRNFGK